MQPKHYLLFSVVAIFFLAGFVLHPDFLSYDSYHFASVVFGKTTNTFMPFFAWFFTQLLPKDVLLLKICIIIPFFVNMLLVGYAGEVIFGRKGWLCGLLLIFNGVFIFSSLILEEEPFVYPILFFAFLIFVWLWMKGKRLFALAAVGLLVYAAYSIWIRNPLGLGFGNVTETTPLLNLLWMAVPVGLGFVGLTKHEKIKFLLPFAVPLAIAGFAIPKFAIFSAPFLAVGCYAAIELLENKVGDMRNILVVFGLLIAVSSMAFIPLQLPQEHEQDAAKFVVQASHDYNKQIINDWEWGHMIVWYGGETSYRFAAGSPKDFNNSIALTTKEIDCELLKNFKKINVYNCKNFLPSFP